MRDTGQRRPRSFYFLLALFVVYMAFLYGPMLCVFILSFQGPTGGMSFPMVGVSLHWFEVLFGGAGGIIGGLFGALAIFLVQSVLADTDLPQTWLPAVYGALLIASVTVGAIVSRDHTRRKQ